MKKIYVLFLILPILCFSQKKVGKARIDSLLVELPKMKEDSLKVNLLNNLATEYQYINPNEGLKYAKNAISISKKIQWNDGLAKSYNAIAIDYYSLFDNHNALTYSTNALKITTNKNIINSSYRNIGAVYIAQNDYPKALNYFFKSLKISEETGNKLQQALTLMNVGATYYYIRDYQKSITYYLKALEINKKLNNKEVLSMNYLNLATSYWPLKQYQKAIEYTEKSLQIDEQIKSKTGEIHCIKMLSKIYLEMGQYDKALQYINLSLQKAELLADPETIAYNLSTKGDIYFEKVKKEKNKLISKTDLENAKICVNKALPFYKKQNLKEYILLSKQRISQIQALQGNYKQALESYQTAIIYKDSIFNSEKKETIKNLEDKRAIELRDKEIKINKLSLQVKEKQKWLLLIGLGLFVIIGFILFCQSRNRKKTNQKLQILNTELDQANKVKARFFGILNHDLRSPVYNLIHYLQLQKESPELLDEATKKIIEAHTLAGAENLLSSMEDMLLWSKGQMENFKPQPKNIAVLQLFDDTKKVFSGYSKIHFEYQNPNNIEIFTDENYLKTIIRNLTGNAIKALDSHASLGMTSTIIWKAWQEHNQTFLSISDNGKGATNEEFKALYDDKEVVGIKSGLGLHLIRDLAKAINCEISVDSKIGVGTTFTLLLK